MRKVINGTVYNVVGSKRIAVTMFRYPGEESLVYECIYKKRNNALFLYCSGGPGTRYRGYLEDGRPVLGQDIIPISHDEARKWLQCHHTDFYYSSYVDIIQFLSELN